MNGPNSIFYNSQFIVSHGCYSSPNTITSIAQLIDGVMLFFWVHFLCMFFLGVYKLWLSICFLMYSVVFFFFKLKCLQPSSLALALVLIRNFGFFFFGVIFSVKLITFKNYISFDFKFFNSFAYIYSHKIPKKKKKTLTTLTILNP